MLCTMMELRVVAMMVVMMMVARDRSTDRTNCHYADVAMHADGVGCTSIMMKMMMMPSMMSRLQHDGVLKMTRLSF